MTIEKISKKDQQYITDLQSGNFGKITSALTQLEEDGSIAVLPTIIELLNSTVDDDITKRAYKLLCELKQTTSVPIIIEAIMNKEYASIQEMLLRACWENGLDYSKYLPTFVDIVIHGSFMNAFEAFTVIENMEQAIDEDIANEMASILSNALNSVSTEKESLIIDLIQQFKA